jgi:tRNA threonylcarbamoyladenosine biosynthesis protein TsaB
VSVELAIESSTRQASLALLVDGKWIEDSLRAEQAHASDLLVLLDARMRALGLAPSSLRVIHVGLGPGSYTGLRVGLACAKGLALAQGTSLRGVCSFEAHAYGELAPGEEACVSIDARAGGWYYARYRREADDVTVLEPLCVLTPAQAQERVQGCPRIFGSDAVPRAGALGALSRRRAAKEPAVPAARLEPLYLRPFAVTERRR